MKFVINLTEKECKAIKAGEMSLLPLLQIIKNGTPLPKGHGDLKDASKMIADLNTVRIDNYSETIEWTCNVIDSYPTIIQADKEGAEK